MHSGHQTTLLNKILIIEDEPDISDYLYDTLAMSGYEVIQAYDGLEGLEKIENENPNLILLDIMMPKLNGIEVCRQLRQNDKTSSIKVIFITAKGSLEEKLEGFQAGANDFIVKPFSSSELLARIEAHLRIDMLARDLELSEKRYRQLIEHSPDGILLFSSDLKLIFINARLKEILPAKFSRLEIGTSLANLTSVSAVFKEISTLLKKVKETRLIVTRTFSINLQKGHSTFLEIRGIPSEIPGNQRGSVYQVVIRDVTEKYNMEKVISRAEKINSLGILTAGIAHEINNPLTGIANAIHIIKRDSIEPEKKEELLELILSNIKRISRIIDDLRVFSRQERYEPNYFEIVPLIEETLKLLRYQRDNELINIEFVTNELKPGLSGNRNQFQQLMLNLLLNASQAIDGKGTIKVEILPTPGSTSSVTLKVSDTGCGISSDQIDQIFDPFFTTKRDWRGTGLGLAVSYRIVQLLKGSISVNSTVGKGTTFTLVLPTRNQN
jgi:PAS domain S-box-containing protein